MDAPTRKKKRPVTSPSPADKDDVEVPERGPWCPKCQAEYMGKQRLQAAIAANSELQVICPGCTAKAVPVMDFRDTHPPPGPVKRPPLEPGVKAIIDHVFQVDYEATWKKLHENIVVGEGRTDHGIVVQNLDWAEDNARQAHQLFVNMKLELERFEIEAKIIWAGLYDEAHAMLQAEKASGSRSKQITDGDVAFKMAELHPDEFRAHEIDKKRFQLAVSHAENFALQWSSKCRSLQTILSKMRGGGVA